MNRKLTAAVLASLLCAAPAWAMNKCTDSAGSVTYQVEACPKNEKAASVKIWGQEKPLQPYRPGSAPQGPRLGFPLLPDPPKKKTPPVIPNAALSGPRQAAALIAFYQRWIDLDTLSRSTARIALAGPVGKMQDLLREVKASTVPPCAEQAKTDLVTLVSGSTDAMLEFMRNNEIGAILYGAAYRDEQIKAFESDITSMTCTKP